MPGMSGDDDEHPANNSAGKHRISVIQKRISRVYSQSSIIAIAISIIST